MIDSVLHRFQAMSTNMMHHGLILIQQYGEPMDLISHTGRVRTLFDICSDYVYCHLADFKQLDLLGELAQSFYERLTDMKVTKPSKQR